LIGCFVSQGPASPKLGAGTGGQSLDFNYHLLLPLPLRIGARGGILQDLVAAKDHACDETRSQF